jgi:hypothetical protein
LLVGIGLLGIFILGMENVVFYAARAEKTPKSTKIVNRREFGQKIASYMRKRRKSTHFWIWEIADMCNKWVFCVFLVEWFCFVRSVRSSTNFFVFFLTLLLDWFCFVRSVRSNTKVFLCYFWDCWQSDFELSDLLSQVQKNLIYFFTNNGFLFIRSVESNTNLFLLELKDQRNPNNLLAITKVKSILFLK